MDKWELLRDELKEFAPNVYFQPPSSLSLVHPCIVFHKKKPSELLANNYLYVSKQGYNIAVIDRDPTSKIADNIRRKLQYCTIEQYYVVDKLNHTTLSLYY